MKKILMVALFLMILPGLSQAAAGIGPRLEKALEDGPEGLLGGDSPLGVWVYFSDKGLDASQVPDALSRASADLSPRTLARRGKVTPAGQPVVDLRDVPLAARYLEGVLATGAQPRRQSRWLNAASFDVTEAQLLEIRQLPFVRKLELVATFFRPETEAEPVSEEAVRQARESGRQKAVGSETFNYGLSTGTLEQINVPAVHELGLTGEGVIIGQLDSGFILEHEALQHIPILAQYDFVHDDDNVQPEPGDHEWQLRHGTQVLSTMAGLSDGELGSPAFGASFILAMTEDTGSETEIEEDNWVAAIEWVEGLGADLVNTSLGYYLWYEYQDLDGNTAVTTVAADMAVGRGMPVITSAGNQRGDSEWPYLTAPADGDSVIACAAVELDGGIAGFSSPGPTADGRIKPDVAAHGVGVIVASYFTPTGYMAVNGTSFSAPLVTGVSALILERVPTLTPMEIREALRETASQSNTPDNDYGWGIIDAYAAVTYYGAAIAHTPLIDTEDVTGPYTVTAEINSRVGLLSGTLFLNWRLDGGTWNQVPLSSAGANQYTGAIPGQPGGGQVEYYLEAGDVDGIVIQAPQGGPDRAWSFTVGVDTIAPSLVHFGLTDQVPAAWPPTLKAKASDNIAVDAVTVTFTRNGGAVQGPFALVPDGQDHALPFPLDAGQVITGDLLSYTLTATDVAGIPNQVSSGPWEIRILDSLGAILVIDNTVFGAAAEDQDAGLKDVQSPGTEMAGWLTEMGYTVQVVAPSAVVPALLDATDAVFLTASRNPAPISESLMRAYLIEYVEAGGKIMLEGGALADFCTYDLGDFEFFAKVLRSSEYLGDGYSPMATPQELRLHPTMVRPNLLSLPIIQDQSSNPFDLHGGDGVTPAEGSLSLLHSVYNPGFGRAVLHDNNTGPEAGQILYYGVAFHYLDQEVAYQILQNSMAYLLAREAPGNGSISGTVTLAGSPDASGVTVSTTEGHSAQTDAAGHYTLPGLLGSTYTLTATKEGYGPAGDTVILAADQVLDGVDFTLYPITEVSLQAAPETGIPDFNATGISSTITVAESGLVNNLSIDIDIVHPSIGQLTVSLESPAGTVVVLHNQTGSVADNIIGTWPDDLIVDGPGTLGDFLNEPVQGDWILKVVDSNFGAQGTFHSWGLNLLVTPDVISAAPEGLPRATRLVGNVPNPFNPQTMVVFDLARTGPVMVDVFDIRGHRVRQLHEGQLEAGRHELLWDGRDAGGRSVASGVYFCRMQTTGATQLMKMALVR